MPNFANIGISQADGTDIGALQSPEVSATTAADTNRLTHFGNLDLFGQIHQQQVLSIVSADDLIAQSRSTSRFVFSRIHGRVN